MSEVKRYGLNWCEVTERTVFSHDQKDGEYVKLSDYSALQQKLDAAEAKSDHDRIQIELLIAALDNEQLLCKRAEHRAEAAEVEKTGAEERCRMMFDAKNHWADRARAAEEKLAELEKQEPVEYQYYYHNHGTGAGQWLPVISKHTFEQMKVRLADDNDFSFRELFTRARR